MIKRIQYTNVKNRSGDHALGPITAIVGPNFSGKTAIADAIRIALLGHHPKLGTSGPATMQLTSEDTLGVALFTTGGVITREWKRKGKTIGKKEAGAIDFDPSWLDAQAFINASPKERIRLVVGGKAGGAEAAIERLGYSPSLVKTFDDLEGLAKLQDEKAKELRTEIKRWEGLLQGSAEIQAEAEMAGPAPDMEALRNASITANGLLQQAQRVIDLQTDMQREAELYAEAGKIHAPYVENAEARLQQVTADLAEAQGIEAGRTKRITELQRQAAEKAGFIRGTQPMSDDEMEQAKIEASEAATLVVADVPALHKAMQAALQESSRAHARVEAADKVLKAAGAGEDNFAKLECCPTCKASAPGWKSAVLSSLEAAAKAAAADWTTATDDHAKALKDYSTAKEAYEAAEAVRQRILALPKLRVRLEESVAREQAVAELAGIQADIEGQTTDHFTTQIAQLQEERDALQAAIAWKAQQPKLPTPEETTKADEHCDAAHTAAIAAGEAESAGRKIMDQLAEREAQRKTATEARKRFDEAEQALAKAVEKAKEIRRVVKEESEALWGRIAKAAERFSKATMNTTLAMNGEGEIGYWNGPTWVPFEAMSGSEQLLASAAIQIGLQQDGMRIVLLDELSRMTPDTKQKFATVLSEMQQAGEFDQAILIDHDSRFWLDTPTEVTVIQTND